MKKKTKINVGRVMFSASIALIMLVSASSVVFADSDYNDSWDEAEYIFDGAYETGTLDQYSDYQDFYCIYLYYGENVNIVMDGDGYDFDLKLYTLDYNYYSYQNELTEVDSSVSGYSYEMIDYLVTSTETYYIEVFAVLGSGSYNLTVDVNQGVMEEGEYYVGGPSYSSGEPLATLPTLEIGDSAYFGNVICIGEEFGSQIDDAFGELEDMGFDVSYDLQGGIGTYMGWEVVDDSTDVNGDECYDLSLFGGMAIDLALEASIDGSTDLGDYIGDISIDGSGSGWVTFEATLDGHMYLTVDELALSKLVLSLEANGEMEANFDVDISEYGYSESVSVEMSESIDDAVVDFQLEFDPPLDLFQYGTGDGAEGIYEGKTWYVPPVDIDVEGSVSAEGTVSYTSDITSTWDNSHEDDTMDLADEWGDESYYDTIPGGPVNYGYPYYDYEGGTLFECTDVSGNIFVIESNLYSSSFFGTRQVEDITSMIPSAGMALDSETGMISGLVIGSELMTEDCTKSDVESFMETPLEIVSNGTQDTDGDGISDKNDDDDDGDDVPDADDAFPLDPAASVDTDGDGMPDEWNDGYSASDSTTGLKVDDDDDNDGIPDVDDDDPLTPNEAKSFLEENMMLFAIIIVVAVVAIAGVAIMLRSRGKKALPPPPMEAMVPPGEQPPQYYPPQDQQQGQYPPPPPPPPQY